MSGEWGGRGIDARQGTRVTNGVEADGLVLLMVYMHNRPPTEERRGRGALQSHSRGEGGDAS